MVRLVGRGCGMPGVAGDSVAIMVVGVRAARFDEDDARLFAWAVDSSLGGLLTTLLGGDARERLAELSLRPGHELSLEHVRIALLDGTAVGAASSMAAQHCGTTARLLRTQLGWRVLRAVPGYMAARPLLKALDWHDAGDWHMVAAAVRPEARGRGVGRALVLDAVDRGREARAEWFTFDIASDNDAARLLAADLGMTPIAVSAPARMLGGVQIQRMVLDLLEPA